MKNAIVRVTIVFACGVFLVFASGLLAASVPQARAYAIGSTASDTTYDFGTSLQNLVAPFTGFFSNLKLNNNTTISISAETSTWPTVNFTPVVANAIQNFLSQCFGDFDNWFYHATGIQLSGIFYVLLNAIAWTLGLAQQAVNWLLGLFHQK